MMKYEIAIELLMQSTDKTIIKSCVRSSESYRQAWLMREQSRVATLTVFTLQDVEELVIRHRNEINNVESSICSLTHSRISSLQAEKENLNNMLATYDDSVNVRFELPDG